MVNNLTIIRNRLSANYDRNRQCDALGWDDEAEPAPRLAVGLVVVIGLLGLLKVSKQA